MMRKLPINKFKHVCPRSCPSSCTMISHIENDSLVQLTGGTNHSYTNGKLCAKGFSYLEKNSHPDRLKFPYYQEVKGSGKFKKITWEKAFDLILHELINIQKNFQSFLPIALYKSTGNVGIHHFVVDEFFSSLGETTKVRSSSFPTAGFDAIQYDVGVVKMSDPSLVKEASMIMIWGANPAATNIHLIPYIIEAKMKGAKIVVVDPLYTRTAELADLFIQLRPGTDGMLANVLIKNLLDLGIFDEDFLEYHSYGFEQYKEALKELNTQASLLTCDIKKEVLDILLNWFKHSKAISHVIGTGLQKHTNGGQNIRAIQALAAINGDIGKTGGGVFFRKNDELLFHNQQCSNNDFTNRVIHLNEQSNQILPSAYEPPIEMMWISCANPLTQAPNTRFFNEFMQDIPFVVTVEQFMTPTAKMSNLILPTTTQFEEMDIVTSFWHKKIALNEQALPPFYESRSEWTIMNELAIRLKKYSTHLCSFPIHSSEKEYLNAQFNNEVFDRYYVNNVSDLQNKLPSVKQSGSVWEKRRFATESGNYQFYSQEAKKNGLPPLPIFIDGKSPTKKYPFWLITPHHPYTFNSQFHFLNINNEHEVCVEIHPIMAEKLGIFNGEVIKIFNDLASIEIKAMYSYQVPKDIVMIYQGWNPISQVNVNELIPSLQTDMGNNSSGANGYAFYDTFVNIGKL